jgi:hypothetical protein
MTSTITTLRVFIPGTALLLLLGSGCREDPLVDSINVAPVANAGPDQADESGAATVTVVLDGSGSTDSDGHIESWHWFSASSGPDGGVALPPGEESTWPEDVANPQVELPEGAYTFSLWVVDERGAVSEPDTVQIQVGNPDPLADPRVAACAAEVVPSVSDPCKACVCSVDDECRTNIVASVCDQTCWDLIDCTDERCPDFAQDMDVGLACILTNCGEFLAAGMAAMAAGRCVIECADVCSAMN